MKKAAKDLLRVFAVASLVLSSMLVAFAWNPSTSNLTGTDSSTDSSVSGVNRRFNIDGGPSGTYGMQAGDDSDSLALLMKMVTVTTSNVPSSPPATVSPAADSDDGTATAFGFQRKCFYAKGRYWAFFYRCPGGTSWVISYFTSTDGSTWSEGAQSPISTSCDEGSRFSLFFDGTYVHYALRASSNYVLRYRRGTPRTDGGIDWSAAQQTAYTANSTSTIYRPCIAVDSSGYAWIGFQLNDGTIGVPYIIKSGNNDGTWGTGTNTKLLSVGLVEGTNGGYSVAAIPLTGGKMLAIYTANSQYVMTKRWTGSSWGSQVNETTSKALRGFAFSATNEGDDVHLVFTKSGTPRSIVYSKYSYSSNSFGTEETAAGSTYVDDNNCGPVLSINRKNNVLYCFWTTWSYMYYNTRGTSWGTPTQWYSNSPYWVESTTCFYESNGGGIGMIHLYSDQRVKFAARVNGGFSVGDMSAGDQYEMNFTVGSKDFAMLFNATGPTSGYCNLFYKDTGAGSWSSGTYFSQTSIQTGTEYHDTNTYIGFVLTNSTSSADGSAKFIVSKSYLGSLGASGTSVTNIVSVAYVNGNGRPKPSGTTPNDRCPSTGTASYTLQQGGIGVPEFPVGVLVLAIPLMGIYFYLRERSRTNRGNCIGEAPRHE